MNNNIIISTHNKHYAQLNYKQRLELAVLLRTTLKQKEIAKILGKDPSTISRELQRNGTKDSKIGYDVRKANQKTKQRRIIANKRFRKIDNNEELKAYIIKRIKKYWSPEQIAGRWNKEQRKKKKKNKHLKVATITHEPIYQFIYNDHPELIKYLRCKKGKYRRRYGAKLRDGKRDEAKKKRIDIRPEIVEKRERIGDWEGDFIFGLERTIGIMTHVERKSGYAIADKMNSLLAFNVVDNVVNKFKGLNRDKKYTITYDNDTRLSEHQAIEVLTGMDIYFAHAYHSWERGTNENTNGLLRQFFPKKMSFTQIKQDDIDKVINLLNTRPRKRLDYLTPKEVFVENCTLD